MPYKEESRKPYRSVCACGNGFVRRYHIVETNDWGQKRERKTEIEINCDFCKSHYHYDTNYADIEFLVPNGYSVPKSIPQLDKKYSYDSKELFIEKHDKTVIENMIADMTAPKHRFIKDLTYDPAIRYAESWAQIRKKKTLQPMIENLRWYLSHYDDILSSYNRKKPVNDEFNKKMHAWQKEEEQVELMSCFLSFEYDAVQDDKDKDNSEGKTEDFISSSRMASAQPWVEYHPTSKIDQTGLYWDSYYIQSCIDPEFKTIKVMGPALSHDIIVKKYHCVCSICGESKEILSSDFEILYDDYEGCYLKVHCECHEVSSFEAKTMDILNRLGIRYRREVTFDGLTGYSGTPLRFDFALYDNQKTNYNDNTQYKLLIELQGPHHYKCGLYNEDGEFEENDSDTAKTAYNKQLEYDERKKKYCQENGLLLECIKYTSENNYEAFERKIRDILI